MGRVELLRCPLPMQKKVPSSLALTSPNSSQITTSSQSCYPDTFHSDTPSTSLSLRLGKFRGCLDISCCWGVVDHVILVPYIPPSAPSCPWKVPMARPHVVWLSTGQEVGYLHGLGHPGQGVVAHIILDSILEQIPSSCFPESLDHHY